MQKVNGLIHLKAIYPQVNIAMHLAKQTQQETQALRVVHLNLLLMLQKQMLI